MTLWGKHLCKCLQTRYSETGFQPPVSGGKQIDFSFLVTFPALDSNCPQSKEDLKTLKHESNKQSKKKMLHRRQRVEEWRDDVGLFSWGWAHTDGLGQREDWLMINLPWPQQRRCKHGPGGEPLQTLAEKGETQGNMPSFSMLTGPNAHCILKWRLSERERERERAI